MQCESIILIAISVGIFISVLRIFLSFGKTDWWKSFYKQALLFPIYMLTSGLIVIIMMYMFLYIFDKDGSRTDSFKGDIAACPYVLVNWYDSGTLGDQIDVEKPQNINSEKRKETPKKTVIKKDPEVKTFQ